MERIYEVLEFVLLYVWTIC